MDVGIGWLVCVGVGWGDFCVVDWCVWDVVFLGVVVVVGCVDCLCIGWVVCGVSGCGEGWVVFEVFVEFDGWDFGGFLFWVVDVDW